MKYQFFDYKYFILFLLLSLLILYLILCFFMFFTIVKGLGLGKLKDLSAIIHISIVIVRAWMQMKKYLPTLLSILTFPTSCVDLPYFVH